MEVMFSSRYLIYVIFRCFETNFPEQQKKSKKVYMSKPNEYLLNIFVSLAIHKQQMKL